jgi:hypothetical protein
MERFEVFQFDNKTRLYFTRIESVYENDGCKHFLFEVEVGEKIKLIEDFEIFEWSIGGIIDNLKELHSFKTDRVDISNDEGQGNLSLTLAQEELTLAQEKKVDISYTATDFLYGLNFKMRADQTVVRRFIAALKQ